MSAYSESSRGTRPRATSARESRTVSRPAIRGGAPAARERSGRTSGATHARATAAPARGAAAGRGCNARPQGRRASEGAGSRAAAKASGILSWAGSHRVACIVAVAIVALVVALYPPAKALYGASRTNAVLAERLDAATSSATQLQGEVDSLMTREGIEDEARRRGYVSEGETAVDVDGVADSGSATTDESVTGGSSQTTDAQEPWYVSALDFFFGYDPSTQGVG